MKGARWCHACANQRPQVGFKKIDGVREKYSICPECFPVWDMEIRILADRVIGRGPRFIRREVGE